MSKLRYCNIKHINNILSINRTQNIGYILTGLGHCKNYSKGKDSCCKDISQTEGRTVEPWPKTQMWPCNYPMEPQPPNYDPYKIRSPEVVVPPLPTSNAKLTGLVYASDQQHGQQDCHQPNPCCDAQNEEKELQEDCAQEQEGSRGFLASLKNFFGWGKKRKSEGDVSMIDPMLDCARVKGPCSLKTVPDPPPCPPPPPPPFPWIYVWSLASFFGVMGLIYKLYLWNEERAKQAENVPIWRPRRVIKRPFHEQDLPACVQYLIVGAGAAGWAAYSAIMEHDKKAKVFFITKEDCLPYRRPPMSKHMWWNPEPPDIKNLYYVEDWKKKTMYVSECHKFMDPVKFYRQKTGPAVSIASGWCVLRVDADDHVVYVKTLCGEQPIYYERCLLAPGSKPKVPSMFKSAPKPVRDRVCTLRTIRDLEIAYRSVKSAKHVVVIGGGPLGCELAWHLGRMNKLDKELDPDKEPIQILHLYKDKGILASVLPEYLGEWAAEKIKNEGVTVKPKVQVYDAYQSADGRLELTLSDGSSIVTDYAFVAVGAEPSVELAEPSFLEVDEVNGGFLVNTELEARTHLYVAGDAASLYSQWKDTRMRMDHYLNAIEQGYIAGANMTGFWTASNMEPHYWVKFEDELQMEVVGEVGACMPTIGIFKQCTTDEAAKPTPAVESGGGDRPCYKKSDEYKNRYLRGMLMYMRDDTVVGFVFWNMPPIEDRSAVATEILRAKPSYKDIDTLADLLGFVGTKCIYKQDEKEIIPGPCIKNWRTF